MTTDSKIGLTQEELTAVAKEQTELVLGTQPYSHENAVLWNRVIVSNIIAQLMKLNKPYKFMGLFMCSHEMAIALTLHLEILVTCVLMQKGGTGLHVASGSFWDTASDVSVSVRWENKFLNCVVEVFAVAQ
ncbi:Tctex-1 domain containing protein [Trichuris trichiura]|uniref:Tctex-1 domain containing protein n=1 Tax=Trichuris trichiura TaxID=36087 RepID=A0A077YX91_TRITR|nr:Tctex-1 domain containing protein [Trichuris trichiura]